MVCLLYSRLACPLGSSLSGLLSGEAGGREEISSRSLLWYHRAGTGCFDGSLQCPSLTASVPLILVCSFCSFVSDLEVGVVRRRVPVSLLVCYCLLRVLALF